MEMATRSLSITIQELSEDDPGYQSELEVLRPDELEEVLSETDTSDTRDDMEDVESDTASAIARRLTKLRCEDGLAGKVRQHARWGKAKVSRPLKRSHSEVVDSSVEEYDGEALNDQDVEAGARRLRRRVESPDSGATGRTELSVTWTLHSPARHPQAGKRENSDMDDYGPAGRAMNRNTSPFMMAGDPMQIDLPSEKQ